MTPKPLFINMYPDEISEALQSAKDDAFMYGAGFVSFLIVDGNIKIIHVPLEDLEKHLENFKNLQR